MDYVAKGQLVNALTELTYSLIPDGAHITDEEITNLLSGIPGCGEIIPAVLHARALLARVHGGCQIR